ncbi:MAG: hypothetical protein FJ095_07510 [Deltaproteobacteria bacterium]|nr:hypothetical protein [Deltaproteobacteria bacterium]
MTHVARYASCLRPRFRLAAVASRSMALALVAGAALAPDAALAQAKKVALKGKVQGGETLLNPVWVEANDAKSHRYTFRTRSTSAGKQQRPTSYLPRELCVALLRRDGAAESRGTPVTVGVSGGRTTPVTIVVPEGQPLQFVNHDPFSHRLLDVSSGGLGPEETKAGGNRTWKPPKAGVFELRDQLAPSLRSWVVVESRTIASSYPKLNGAFVIRDLEPGAYDLQAYFMGKPVGKALPVDVKVGVEEQEVRDPLVVSEPKKSDGEGK